MCFALLIKIDSNDFITFYSPADFFRLSFPQNGTILAWKFNSAANTFEPAASLAGHTLPVVSLVSGADRLYSASMDHTITVGFFASSLLLLFVVCTSRESIFCFSLINAVFLARFDVFSDDFIFHVV